MNKTLCMNALAVIDGEAKPSRDLVRAIKTAGAEAFHAQWVSAMQAAGWRAGGRATNHDVLMTPHIRKWSLLVDAQRAPLFQAGAGVVEATWSEATEATQDEVAE